MTESQAGGLLIALGAAVMFIALVVPTRPRRSVDRLLSEESTDYFLKRAQASARAGVRLWPRRHVVRAAAAGVMVVGLILVVLD